MSKTAQQWVDEATNFRNQNRMVDAMRCVDEALKIDPNHGSALFKKAFYSDMAGKQQDAYDWYQKAIAVGYELKVCHYNAGNALKALGKNTEAVTSYKKALEVDPKYADCWENVGDCYMLLEKYEEAIAAYYKTLELDPKRDKVHPFQGVLLEDVGRNDEAMKQYNECLSINPRNQHAILFKGNLLSKLGKYKEAVEVYESSKAATPWGQTTYRLGNAYMQLGQKDKATETYALADRLNPQNPQGYCYRGQCYYLLGRKEQALKDFKECQTLLDTKNWTYAPSQTRTMKQMVKSIFEVEEAQNKAEETLKQMSDKNPAAQRFVASVKKLTEERDRVQQQLIINMEKKDVTQNTQNLSDLDKIKEEFSRQLAQMQAEMRQLNTEVKEVKVKVEKLANNMDEMKQELANKMDDFDKKLTNELNKQDVSVDDQKKLKSYFRAFVGTFSSTHVTSQVIDSGQVQLDSDNSTATFLSVVASFAPFVGSVLQSGIKSLGDFLQAKEMKTNARKMKNLAHDPSHLSQIVGKAAFEILMNKKKQKQVIEITEKDLRQKSSNLFRKLADFCAELNDKIDAALYTKLYQTAAEEVGHFDANDLIELWLKGEISPNGAEEQFVEEILQKLETSVVKNESPAPSPTKQNAAPPPSACCNIF